MMMEHTINHARSLISVLAGEEAISYLVKDGVDPESAYLAVKAAEIIQKDRAR